MTRLTDLEYLQLGRLAKFRYKFVLFFILLFPTLGRFFQRIGKKILAFFIKVGQWFKEIGTTFVKGDWRTKVSYVIWGFGSFARKQYLRGALFLLFELLFIALWYSLAIIG